MKSIIINISALLAGGSFAASVFAGVIYAQPLLKSDPLPWKGIKESYEDLMKLHAELLILNNDTQALVVKGQILATWNRCDTARKAHDSHMIDYQEQLADLQVSYMKLTGDNYPIGSCP